MRGRLRRVYHSFQQVHIAYQTPSVIMILYIDKQLSGDSTEEMPVAPESVDDYEIEKKYEMVYDIMTFKLCVYLLLLV